MKIHLLENIADIATILKHEKFTLNPSIGCCLQISICLREKNQNFIQQILTFPCSGYQACNGYTNVLYEKKLCKTLYSCGIRYYDGMIQDVAVNRERILAE